MLYRIHNGRAKIRFPFRFRRAREKQRMVLSYPYPHRYERKGLSRRAKPLRFVTVSAR